MEYRALCEFDPSRLSEVVDDHLKDGWELYGDLKITTDKTNVYFAQAMTLKTKKAATKRFTPPTGDEVLAHMLELVDWGVANTQSINFIDYYDSNGWKVGKNKMANWKAAATNWIKRNEQRQNGTISSKPTATSKGERVASKIDNLFK